MEAGQHQFVANDRRIWRVRSIYRRIRPDILHHVALEPLIVGSAPALGLPIVRLNAFARLGYAFSPKTFNARVVGSTLALMLRFLLQRPQKEIVDILHEANLYMKDVDAHAMVLAMDKLERIDQMVSKLNAPRNALLREIERCRETFAANLRRGYRGRRFQEDRTRDGLLRLSPMASERKIEANRANGRVSPDPETAQGKNGHPKMRLVTACLCP